MKKQHLKIKRLFVLFALCCICLPAIFFAKNGPFELFTEHPKNEINFDTSTHDGRMQKLRHDLEEFETNGANQIPPDNMFYPTNETHLTAEEIDSALKDTNLKGTGNSFHDTENKEGISSLFFAAIANHESYYGYSNIARNKNNIFGFNAQDDDPFNKANEYASLDDCIQDVGHKIKKMYLNSNGRYFNGYSAKAMSVNYSTDPDWAIKVNDHMIRIAREVLDHYGY